MRVMRRKLLERITPWVPRECLDPKRLRRTLRNLPKAQDLLQAIVRRAIGPERTTDKCPLCGAPATALHILTAHPYPSTIAGVTRMPRSAAMTGPDSAIKEINTMRNLLRLCAQGNDTALLYVCERVLLLQEEVSTEWAKRLHRAITQSQ